MPLKNKYSGKTEPAEVILDKFILTMAIQIYIVFLWIKWLNVNYLDIIIIINYTSIKINSKLHLIIIIQQKVWLNVKKRLLFVTLNRIVLISSLHNTTYILHCLFVCLFICLTGLHYLPCALCHFIHFYIIIFYLYFYLMYFFFLHVLICIFVIVVFLCTYMFVYIFYLYLSVFLRSTVSV